MSQSTPTIVIVRITNRQSSPMVGITCAIGGPGMICWDSENRKFNPHSQVLVDKITHKIISFDSKSI